MSEWQPIETAPRDGTHIDLWAGGSRVPNAFYHDDWGWTVWVRWVRNKRQASGPPTGSHRYTGVESPTHWQPLPEPPTDLNLKGRPHAP